MIEEEEEIKENIKRPEDLYIDLEMCPEHPDEFLCLICDKHNKPLCPKCIEFHQNETYKEYNTYKAQLESCLVDEEASMKKVIHDYDAILQKLAKRKEFANGEVEKEKKRLDEFVDQFRDKVGEKIEQLRRELNKNTNNIINLETQIQELKQKKMDMEECIKRNKAKLDEIKNEKANDFRINNLKKFNDYQAQIQLDVINFNSERDQFDKTYQEFEKHTFEVLMINKDKALKELLEVFQYHERWLGERTVDLSIVDKIDKRNESLFFIDSITDDSAIYVYKKTSTKIFQKYLPMVPILSGAAMYFYSSRIIIAGGFSKSDFSTEIIFYEDPTTGTKRLKKIGSDEMAEGRAYFPMTGHNNCIYFFGGRIKNRNLTEKCEKYDFEAKKVIPIPNLNQKNFGMCATKLNENIFVFGGIENVIETINTQDLRKWKKIKINNPKVVIGIYSACFPILDQIIIIFGGFDKTKRKTQKCFLFNNESMDMFIKYKLPIPMAFYNGSPILEDNKIVVVGNDMASELNILEFDIGVRKWFIQSIQEFQIIYNA